MEHKQRKRLVKVRLGHEGRFIEASDTLHGFTKNIKKEFKLKEDADYILSCKDKTNKITNIESEETYNKFKDFIINYPKLIEPSFIPNPNPKKNEIVTHKNTKCSVCGESPIKGIRYKCLYCTRYDLCSECEKKCGKKHGHPLLKLRKGDDLEKYGKIITENLNEI